MCVKQLTLNEIRLSANPYLHESIIAVAKTGMEQLCDYFRSPEYADLWRDIGDRHPADDEDDNKKKKKQQQQSSPKPKQKQQQRQRDDDDDDDGGHSNRRRDDDDD